MKKPSVDECLRRVEHAKRQLAVNPYRPSARKELKLAQAALREARALAARNRAQKALEVEG